MHASALLRRAFALALVSALLCAAAGANAALPDGVWTPDGFTYTGGTGRVTITCPQVTVTDGAATAAIVFSSPNYTTLTLDGVVYEAEHEGESSIFQVPVPLGRSFTVSAVTTAMSQPHAIDYTLFIRLDTAGESAVPGVPLVSSMELAYAEAFSVDFYEGGYALIDVPDGARCLTVPEGMPVPEGLDPEIVVLQLPLQNVYLAASSAMSLVARLDAMDAVRFSGTEEDGWFVDAAAQAMREGKIVFAGRYSQPDYELLVKEGCSLAIESTMIQHAPKVREMLELLGIPVFVDRSSYEPHPLGRTEWIRLYGVLLGCEEQAEAFFTEQKELVEALAGEPASGKTVAFFYINTDGAAVVRGSRDFVARMIELGGGEYLFADMEGGASGRASVPVTMEEFYVRAASADFLIYNTAIDTTVRTLDDLRAKSPLMDRLIAVREGRVWTAGRDFYQATDLSAAFIADISRMLQGREDGMTFLHKLD